MAELQSKNSSSNRLLSSVTSAPSSSYSNLKSVAPAAAKPSILPVPTPNPGSGGGSGAPTAVSYNTNSKSWETTPSWDYKRFGATPEQAAQSPQAKANLAQNINNSVTVNKTQTPSGNSGGNSGGLTADILMKQFGFNDPNVIKDILSDPGKRAQYERELSPSSSAPSGPSKEEIATKYRDKTGLDIDPSLLDKLKGDTDGGADIDALIRDIEASQRGAAEEEYMASMDVLGKQKGELKDTSEYQKGKINKQLGLDREELNANKTADIASIDKAKERFTQENNSNEDLIAANWRDLSLRTQAIARARGITSSDFAGQIESKQAMELNKGLRTLATNAQNVYADFLQGLTDTNSFYAKADQKLTSDAQTRLDDTDQWLQGEVSKIQSLERVSLGEKLSQIKSAAAEASKLKLGIAQQAETRRQNLEDWLLQTKVNFDNALKLSAQGNIASASDKIKEQTAYFNMIKSGLQSGALALTQNESGSQIVGGLPFLTGSDQFSSIQTTPEAYNAYQSNLKQADALKNLQGRLIGGINFNPDETGF